MPILSGEHCILLLCKKRRFIVGHRPKQTSAVKFLGEKFAKANFCCKILGRKVSIKLSQALDVPCNLLDICVMYSTNSFFIDS